MTETVVAVEPSQNVEPDSAAAVIDVPETRAVDELEVARELVRQARDAGVALTGPGGLLKAMTKTVIETALDEELSDCPVNLEEPVWQCVRMLFGQADRRSRQGHPVGVAEESRGVGLMDIFGLAVYRRFRHRATAANARGIAACTESGVDQAVSHHGLDGSTSWSGTGGAGSRPVTLRLEAGPGSGPCVPSL